MKLTWLDGYRGPIWAVAGPLLLCTGTAATLSFGLADGVAHQMFASTSHIIGTILMLSVLPPYLTAAFIYLYRETRNMVTAMADMGESASTERLRRQAGRLTPWAICVVVLSVVYGFYQNQHALRNMWAGEPYTVLDVGVVLGNALIWFFVGFLVSWRIPVSLALRRFGRDLTLDLYQPDRLGPFANLATKDVLIVAGAMAFMPLQALDAEFRWVNYQSGLTVGIPSAVLLLFTPLSGIRSAIVRSKEARLAELTTMIEQTPRQDVARLETLSAHKARVRGISNWAVDFGLATRIVGYAVIAPLAWVGAALVENIVDQFAG